MYRFILSIEARWRDPALSNDGIISVLVERGWKGDFYERIRVEGWTHGEEVERQKAEIQAMGRRRGRQRRHPKLKLFTHSK